jgi:hypothetical protein
VAMFPNAVTPATLLMASPQFSQDMGAATTTFSGNGSNVPRGYSNSFKWIDPTRGSEVP